MFIVHTRKPWKQDYYTVLIISPIEYTLGLKKERNSQRWVHSQE